MAEFASVDLDPELRSYYDEVLKINHAAKDLIRGLSEAQLLWRPEPRVWSIAQCLSHLVASGRTELPSVHRAIAEARARKTAGHGPYSFGLPGWLLIKVMGPQVRLKFKAPKAYLPDVNKAPGDIICEFFLFQQELLDCIRDADGLDLARTKVQVHDYKYIRLSLGQEFELFIVHEQRHILQAQRVKNEPRLHSAFHA